MFKLQAAPPPRELSGYVAVITGAGSDVGRAIADRLARDGAHLVLAGGDAPASSEMAASLPADTAVVAEGDPIASAIAAFRGIDILVALEPVAPEMVDRLEMALRQQDLAGAAVGLETALSATLDITRTPDGHLRSNTVQIADGAPPMLVAEAVAFLVSPHAAATRQARVPVG